VSEAEWRALLAEKEARIVQLEAIIEELRAALGLNSLNSSIAPSRDDSAARGKRRAKAAKHARRRKKEAQRQNRAKRSLLPPESVTSTEQHRPPACNACGEHLRARDMLSEPERVQKFELPEIRPLVHEIQVFSGKCRCCGEITKAVRPAEATTSKVGTRLRAFMMLLIGRFHLSRRDVVDFLGDVMQCDISLGLLSKIETQTAATLETAYQEAVEATTNAPVRYVDETGWAHGTTPGWLWVASTALISRFLIDDRRGAEVAQQLLGPNEPGVTVSDRWVAYAHLKHRQLCWAHLDRTAQGLVERGGVSELVGQRVLDFIHEMFSIWHRHLEGLTSRINARGLIVALGNAMLEDIQRIPNQPRAAQTFVKGILKVRQHLFTFVRVEGVEPTNNRAERAIRPAVMWRRKSQATRSERGRRFVERMLTVVGSCRAQGRSIFEFLCDTLDPVRPSPSLLPATV